MTKNVKMLLAVSLLLNILLIGFVAGTTLDIIGKNSFSARTHADLSSLPPDIRERLNLTMEEAFEANRPLHEKIQETRKEAVNILQTEPFDERAFEEKIDALFGYMEQMGKAMTSIIKDFAQEVPLEDRAAIAKMIMRGPPRDRETQNDNK